MRVWKIMLLCLAGLAAGIGLSIEAATHAEEIADLLKQARLYVYGKQVQAEPTREERGAVTRMPSVIPARANWTWQTRDGTTYQNVIVRKIEIDAVTIDHSLGVAHIPLENLPSDIQQQFNYDPNALKSTALPSRQPLTKVADMLEGKLLDPAGGALAAPGTSTLFYAIYYAASWDPPCQSFTPTLTKWYATFKPRHANFELIYVSEDAKAEDDTAFKSAMGMPWPSVRFDALHHPGEKASDGASLLRGPGIQQYVGADLPDLVLVDSSGQVLADSFAGTNYVGPQPVVDYMNIYIPETHP